MKTSMKYVMQLCFCIWVINRIFPVEHLMEHQAFTILFYAGICINIVILVLGLTAFLMPKFAKRHRKNVDENVYKYIIHDLDNKNAEILLRNIANAKILSARKKTASCNGCYGCWLKTPGLCVKHDSIEAAGKEIACCSELIIISKNLYGGLSKEIKKILDRSISFALPFFAVRNNEQHHQLRYTNDRKMKVCIYNSNEISDADRNTLTEITKANCINMDINRHEIIYVQNIHELNEVLK